MCLDCLKPWNITNMIPIIINNDPASVSRAERYEIEPGRPLFDWIVEHYGPDGFDVDGVRIFKGSISELTEIDWRNDENAFRAPVTEPIYIQRCPEGVGSMIIYAIIVAVAIVALMPRPTIPNSNARQQQKSPNNAVGGQTNVARLLERVPDIFGTDKSYPDLIAPTVSEFIDQEKFLTDYMVIGRGYYDTPQATVKTGDTPIDDIPGSTVAFYDPGTEPTEVLRSIESNEVKAQILKGPNSQDVKPGGDPFWYDDTNDLGYIMTTVLDEYDNFSPGQSILWGNIRADSPPFLEVSGLYTINTIEPWVYLTPMTFSGGTLTWSKRR